MPIQTDIVDEVNRLVDEAQNEQINLRLIGGLAVRMHSPLMDDLGLKRDYADIDFVANKREQRRLEPFFALMGYVPDKMFNALNGAHRQIYHDPHSGRHVDIFVGDFVMCHKLPMHDRLRIHPVTVPLAELFLSKTQIVQLNKKDAYDLIALLLNNPIGTSDEGKINVQHIARLCARDWGLYTTTIMNLDRLENILRTDNPGLDEAQTAIVSERIAAIRQAMHRTRKGFRWQVRDRIGTRLRWYVEVEEVRR